jgi:uncharacterized membrane protein
MTIDKILIVSLVIHGLLLWVIPTISRPGIFFGVTVPPDFRTRPVARGYLRRYRLVVASAAGLALIAMPAVTSPRVKVAMLLLQTLAAFAAWIWTHRAVRSMAGTVATVPRVAVLAPRDTSVPGGVLTLVGPFLILAAAALLLYSRWDLIPDRFPTRWNLDGSPQRWATKSMRSVYGGFAFGGALLAAFTAQTVLLLKRTRQIAAAGPAADAEWRFKRRTVLQSILATYMMAIGASYFATRPLFDAQGGLGAGIWLWMGAVVVLTTAFVSWMLWVGQGGQRRVPAGERAPVAGDATPDSAWGGGLFYFNPEDPAIFVEKRMGVGWTLNFGNVWSWAFLALALGAPILVLRLLRP